MSTEPPNAPWTDALPAPSQLGLRDETEKITIVLSKRSVDFFRKEAARNGAQYQRMIRELLDLYVDSWQGRHSGS